MKKMYKIFTAITIISTILLFYIINNVYTFKHSNLPDNTLLKLHQKEQHLKNLTMQKYNISINVPIIVSSKLPSNLFGIALYNDNKIKILLNKNRFFENEEYMIDYVLPHEYAHALMFVFNDFTKKNGGHTKRWQNICLNLGGKKCDRFVKDEDIIMGKLKFLY